MQTRRLSKEANNSVANSSFRVYYGGACGSVPFRWESTPGTPKHAFLETSIPPLTPPPSYYFSSNSPSNIKSSKTTLFTSFFPRKKSTHNSPAFSFSSGSSSPSSLSSWSSSRSSFCSSPSAFIRPKLFRRRCLSETPSLPFEYIFDEDGQAPATSPTSTLCFGSTSKNGFRGCYQFVSVKKKALLSMVRHGSAGRGTVIN